MSIEKAISIQCMDMYNMHQHFIAQQSKGFIKYDPVVLAKISQVVNHDCLKELYQLADHIPSLLRLDFFKEKKMNFVALTDFAYTLYNARFSIQHQCILEQKRIKLDEMLTAYSKLYLSITKNTNKLSFEEAKAMAWDSLPSANEYEAIDYLANIYNPFISKTEQSFKIHEPLYRFRFFKLTINEVCVGWEFFSAE